MLNNIVWANNAGVEDNISVHGGGEPLITYSNIQGGWNGEGNIDTAPLFRDPDNGDFHLMAQECGDPFDSPCIDSGDPSIFDYILDCDWGLGYERSDMGAYGGMAIPTDIRERDREVELPARLCMSQNYPNPFNSSTTITFSLSEPQSVSITIYDLIGRRIETLATGKQQAGSHTVVWEAGDIPSGVYFYRIKAGESSQTRKLVLLK